MDDVTFTLVADRFLTRPQVGKLASKLGIVDAATGLANPTPDQRLAINATAAVLVMAMAIGTSENTTQGLITAFREFITPTPFPPPPAPAPPVA
jgi:hypothetical protein